MNHDATYSDFSNVEAMHNYVIPEEFADGPYGSPVNRKLGKSTAWDPGQRPYSNFNYEDKTQHEGLPRQYPGAHPTHDDPEHDEQPPYQTT